MRKTTFTTGILTFLLSSLVSGGSYADQRNTLIVNWDGTGDYLTISDALTNAGNNDIITVMPSTGSPSGAYVENITIPAITVTLKSSDPNDPSVVAETVIDGNGAGTVVTFDLNATANTILEGFTIRNGNSTGGGGITSANGSPVIRKCVITGNTADEGGGIRIWNGTASIEDCTITGNTATMDGGGVFCMSFMSGVTTTLTNCIISDNTADGDWTYGGGVGCDGHDVTIIGGQITGNTSGSTGMSGSAGGGVYSSDAVLNITGCTISGNQAIGGQCYGGGVSTLNGTATLSNCTIEENSVNAVDWYGGGGVSSQWSHLTISGGEINDNSADGYPALENGGAGIYALYGTADITNCPITDNHTPNGCGGGVLSESAETTISKCTIAGNSSDGGAGILLYQGSLEAHSCGINDNESSGDGGGIYTAEAEITLKNCTVVNNSTDELIGAGGGIVSFDSTIHIDSSILWGDTAVFGPEISLWYWTENVGSHADVVYSDIAGGEAGVDLMDYCTLTWGTGNIDTDPLFVAGSGAITDFHLTDISPSVDTGNNSTSGIGAQDIDGEDRVQGCRVDMGADEANAPFGDMEPDGDVDLVDFSEFQKCFGMVSTEPGAVEACFCKFDFDGSGEIDLGDLPDWTALLNGPQ